MSAPGTGSAPSAESSGEPRRITALPFFYTAPVALLIAGALLFRWGALALSSPWSSLTLALTHVVTLGFLTMTALGVFYALASGLEGMARPGWAHGVYYSLILGVAGLAWGTSHAESGPVFLSIGAVGVMAVIFVFRAARGLRRAEEDSPVLAGLRLAVWGFTLAAFLGIWLAHGHGGMLFPGLRSLWMQVHLSIALLGWLGAMLVTASFIALPGNFGAAPLGGRTGSAVMVLTRVGLFVPFVLLLFTYFGADVSLQARIEPWAAAALLPAAAAIWLIHPVACLYSLRGAAPAPGLGYWRLGLVLAPLVFLVALSARMGSDPRLPMLFGWLAVFGWGATLFSAVLVGTVPGLLGSGARGAGPGPSSAVASRVGLGLHAAALGAGLVGILALSDIWCRLAGALVFADAAWLMVGLTRILLASRPERASPA
ncbi:MAG: hypothetical protein NZ990_06835 [Myxococcota bacterium]|nr:hypothetical protein [Myxococcota bacterium]